MKIQLEFGNLDHVAFRKSRKRKKNIGIGGGDPEGLENLIEFKLCITCVKVVQKGVIRPSDMFVKICDKCKEKYCGMANKSPILGALVNVI